MCGEEETLFDKSADTDSERWGLDAGLEQQERFDADFKEFLNPKSSTGRLMFAFVGRELRAFRLSSLYRESYVLNEAYIRGRNTIQKGGTIRHSGAWLRGTAFRIIRELSREHQKTVSLQESFLENQPVISTEELQSDLATLRMAFQLLPLEDQELLYQKIVEDVSWREIRETLRLRGYGDFSEATLRKRKERALIRLRKKYHTIRPSEF